MIEIKYNDGKLSYHHDGRSWEEEKLIDHLADNGHGREVVGFGVPIEVYDYCCDFSRRVETMFDDKGLPKTVRDGL